MGLAYTLAAAAAVLVGLIVAYRAFRGTADETDPAANPALRLVRRAVPTTEDPPGR